ncbi:unnamed protein product [Alternaria sp. RS040]
MSNKNIVPRVNWDRDFPWKVYSLRYDITTAIPDYEEDNPRTWPLIRDAVTTEYRPTVPPKYLAYDQTLIKSFERLQGPPSRPSRTSKYLTNLFLYYPFNYDRHGQLREHPHITSDELEEWKRQMSRTVPTTKKEAVTKNATTNDHTNDEATKNVSSEAAINEIMKMLDDSDADSDMIPYTRVVDLETELEKTRKQVSEARKRADTAERRIEALKIDLSGRSNNLKKSRGKVDELEDKVDELEDKMEALKDEVEELKDEAEELKDEVEDLKAKVKQSNKNVSAAKQKTAVKEQQILRILEGMRKKKQGAGFQKRKSSEDASEAQQKRLRTEV